MKRLISGEIDEKTKDAYFTDLKNIATFYGFDKAGHDQNGDIFFMDKEGKLYKVEHNFLGSILPTLLANKFSITGGISGSITGARLAPKGLATLGGAVVGGAIGSYAGAGVDAILSNQLLNREQNFKEIHRHMLEEGALSAVGDGVILGLVKSSNGILKLTTKSLEAVGKVAKNTPIIGNIKNMAESQNLRAAQDLALRSFSKEEREELLAFAKNIGGAPQSLHSKDLNKGLEYLKEKFGEDSRIYNTAQSLNDIFTPKMPLRAKQQELLAVIRNSEDNDVLDILKEVAKINPQANKNLRNMLGLTTANLKSELQKFDINPQDIKIIFDDYTKGTKAAYEEANEKILSKIYDDNYKVVLDSKEFDKFYEEQLKYYEIPSAYKNTLLSIKHKVYNPQGVTYKDLEATRKSLNNLYSEDKTLDSYLKNFISSHLREDINKGINNIFSQNKEAYEQAKTLYETKLADYANLKEIQNSSIYEKIQNVDNSLEDIAKAILKNAKGAGKIAGAENPPQASKAGTNNKTLLNNFDELTKGLTEQNRQSLELNLLDKIFAFSLVKNGETKVLDSTSFLKALEENKQIFKSKGSKEYIQAIQDFHKLFKRDADILNSLPNPNPKENTSNIATTFDGPIKHVLVDGVFGRIYRNFTHDGILFGAFFPTIGLGIQKAALKYHLSKALKESSSLENFNFNITQRANRGGFNSPTKELVERIVEQVSEAKEEALRAIKEGTKAQEIPQDLKEQWLKEFNLESLEQDFIPNFIPEVKEALNKENISEIKVTKGSLIKLLKENRLKYMDRIKPTLQNPDRIIIQDENTIIFAKDFNDKKYFTSVARDENGEWIVRSNAPKSESGLNNKISKGGREIYQASSQINAITPYDDIANSNIKLDTHIIPQSPTNQSILDKALKEKQDGIAKEQRLQQESQQKQAKRASLLNQKRQSIQQAKDSNVGKSVNEVELLLSDSIPYTPLRQTSINLENKTYNAKYVIIKKQDLKPNFSNTGTQGRLIKQTRVIEDIQNNLNPNKLFFSEGGFDGLPIILADGSVSVGNHRAEALKRLSKESLHTYKEEAKKAFNVDLREDEVIVRMLDFDIPKQEVLNLSFASNVGREQNIAEKALSTLGKYQEGISKLPNRLTASSVEEMQSIVSKTLDTTNNGLNTFDTNLALFTHLAKTRNKSILESLESLKGSAEEKQATLRMFVENAGSFYNISQQTLMPKLDLRDYLAQALYFTIKASPSRRDNFREVITEIQDLLKTTDTQGKNAFIEQNPDYYEDLIGKIMGYSLARFKELENPPKNLFEFLSNLETALRQELEPTLFSNGRAISTADIYDFLSMNIKSGIPSEEASELLELLPKLKEKQEGFKNSQTLPPNPKIVEDTQETLPSIHSPQSTTYSQSLELIAGFKNQLVQGLDAFFENTNISKASYEKYRLLGVDKFFSDFDIASIHNLGLNKDYSQIYTGTLQNGKHFELEVQKISPSNNSGLNFHQKVIFKIAKGSGEVEKKLEWIRHYYKTSQKDETLFENGISIELNNGEKNKLLNYKQNAKSAKLEIQTQPLQETLEQKHNLLPDDDFKSFLDLKAIGDNPRYREYKGENIYNPQRGIYSTLGFDFNSTKEAKAFIDEAQSELTLKEIELLKDSFKEIEIKTNYADYDGRIRNNYPPYIKLNDEKANVILQYKIKSLGFDESNHFLNLFEKYAKNQNEFLKANGEPFGINFKLPESKDKGKLALKVLSDAKMGQVKGVFFREDLKELSGNGEIDLVWGEVTNPQTHKGYGLAHIIDKHPDFDINLIPEIIERGKLINQNNMRYRLEFESYVIGLSSEFKGEKQNFIITAFERNKDLDTLSPKPKITDKSDNILPNLDTQIIPQTPEEFYDLGLQISLAKSELRSQEKDLDYYKGLNQEFLEEWGEDVNKAYLRHKELAKSNGRDPQSFQEFKKEYLEQLENSNTQISKAQAKVTELKDFLVKAQQGFDNFSIEGYKRRKNNFFPIDYKDAKEFVAKYESLGQKGKETLFNTIRDFTKGQLQTILQSKNRGFNPIETQRLEQVLLELREFYESLPESSQNLEGFYKKFALKKQFNPLPELTQYNPPSEINPPKKATSRDKKEYLQALADHLKVSPQEAKDLQEKYLKVLKDQDDLGYYTALEQHNLDDDVFEGIKEFKEKNALKNDLDSKKALQVKISNFLDPKGDITKEFLKQTMEGLESKNIEDLYKSRRKLINTRDLINSAYEFNGDNSIYQRGVRALQDLVEQVEDRISYKFDTLPDFISKPNPSNPRSRTQQFLAYINDAKEAIEYSFLSNTPIEQTIKALQTGEEDVLKKRFLARLKKEFGGVVEPQITKEISPFKHDFSTTSTNEAKTIIKNHLKPILNTTLTSADGNNATLSLKSLNKMVSDSAVNKSIQNGFNRDTHLNAVANIENLFKNAKLQTSYNGEKVGDNTIIHRFNSEYGNANALITTKESLDKDLNKVYSLELELTPRYHSNPPTKRELAEAVNTHNKITSGEAIKPSKPIVETDNEIIPQSTFTALEDRIKEFAKSLNASTNPQNIAVNNIQSFAHWLSGWSENPINPEDILKNPKDFINHYNNTDFRILLNDIELLKYGIDLKLPNDLKALIHTLKSQAQIDSEYAKKELNQSPEALQNAEKHYKEARARIEQHYNLSPLKGFGTNYAEYYHDGSGAIKKILAEAKGYEARKELGELTQSESKEGQFKGQVVGAFYRQDLEDLSGNGDITLVWGDEKAGLAHILARRKEDFINQGVNAKEAQQKALEFIRDLPTLIQQGNLRKEQTRAFIELGDHLSVIALNYKGEANNWVLTAYKKRKRP
ncbi:putative barnase/colicin E5 family endoribonuclease [Helicobacter mesocricetorum]|uniref:putative barnase/colicin E5 family endoribonuclease n=1 Tax=Helicobacter mesocricetorum TaxID=87012 RepID=UPI001F2BE98C|nr:PBECR2 nuclease fold domain-containing protein [Helicobacter mesocricetorum]